MENILLQINNSTKVPDAELASGVLGLTILFISFFIIIALIVIFPLFIVISRINKEKDQATSVYPIINHFYKAVCVCYLMYLVFIPSFTYVTVVKENYAIPLLYWTSECSKFFIMTFVHVQEVIVCLLAMQKFMIYFFLGREFPLELSSKILYVFHSLAFVPMGVLLIAKWVYDLDFLFLFPIYRVCYIVINIALLISAILYIPVVISIQKYSYLPSVQQQKPHNYMLNQTFSLAAFKMINFFVYLFQTQLGSSSDEIIALLAFCDVFSTPLNIQFSYLLSNKNNVDLLKRNLSLTKVYSIFFKGGSVEPTVRETTQAEATTTRF